MKTAIALGSNIGDRLQNLRRAAEEIRSILGVIGEPLKSRIYETDPVDSTPDTSPYLNAVIEIEYDGKPLQLLEELRRIEQALGRPARHPRNASRTIDLDVLHIGDLVLHGDTITLPHPRMTTRRFVLAPLSDIEPALVLPGQQETVAKLLDKLPHEPRADIFSESW
jgi:2-amino-4-hydroxy-6-hydroxymethyldihydropteridine diphosphokinase